MFYVSNYVKIINIRNLDFIDKTVKNPTCIHIYFSKHSKKNFQIIYFTYLFPCLRVSTQYE